MLESEIGELANSLDAFQVIVLLSWWLFNVHTLVNNDIFLGTHLSARNKDRFLYVLGRCSATKQYLHP